MQPLRYRSTRIASASAAISGSAGCSSTNSSSARASPRWRTTVAPVRIARSSTRERSRCDDDRPARAAAKSRSRATAEGGAATTRPRMSSWTTPQTPPEGIATASGAGSSLYPPRPCGVRKLDSAGAVSMNPASIVLTRPQTAIRLSCRHVEPARRGYNHAQDEAAQTRPVPCLPLSAACARRLDRGRCTERLRRQGWWLLSEQIRGLLDGRRSHNFTVEQLRKAGADYVVASLTEGLPL